MRSTARKASCGISTEPIRFIRCFPSFCFSSSFRLRDVAAVALGEDVLAHRPDRLAADDMRADRGLDRHLEHLPRDELLELLDQRLAGSVRVRAMDDEAQRVDRLPAHEEVELDEIAVAVADVLVVEAGVPARSTLQQVVEVDDELAERHLEMEVHSLRIEVLHVLEL